MSLELDANPKYEPPLDIIAIESILPHRYPFLLVDRILDFELGKRIKGLKNVTRNEEFFNGHFPGNPIMPGALITEHMAQVAGVLLYLTDDVVSKLALFRSIEQMKFRKQVHPGDTLITEAEIIALKGITGKVSCVTKVDDQIVAQGILSFALVEC